MFVVCVCVCVCVQVKKVILVVDAVANGLWTFMWFVAFVYLTDQWRKTSVKDASSRNCGNSGVAFSFFCMFIWVRNNYILCWSRVSS